MTTSASDRRVVLHLSGRDRPGITSAVTRILSSEGGRLIDIGQSVLHGYLALSAIADFAPGSDGLRQILFEVSRLGMKLEVLPFSEEGVTPTSMAAPFSLMLLGSLGDGRAVARTTKFLAEHQMNILELKTLQGNGALRGLEISAELPRGSKDSAEALFAIRGELLKLSGELGVDLAVQRDDIYRRNRRMVCMDVDSTFVQMEVIDELARLAGAGEKVAAITERAMRGEMDFKQALAERVSALKGLSFERAKSLLNSVPLTPGAEQLARTLKGLGYQVGLVSGGFDFFVDELKRRFDLDFAFANRLEVENGLLTGRVLGTVVDAERKAQLLRDMAQVYRCRLEQTVAIGDGANDMMMLQTAGLGIAFRAKPKLQSVADLSLNRSGLDGVLDLMGLSAGG
jgi:phosphoserine phosphatase